MLMFRRSRRRTMVEKSLNALSTRELAVPGAKRQAPPPFTLDSGRECVGLVLADRYPIVLRGLEKMFRTEPGVRVLASCTDREQVPASPRHRTHVLLPYPH